VQQGRERNTIQGEMIDVERARGLLMRERERVRGETRLIKQKHLGRKSWGSVDIEKKRKEKLLCSLHVCNNSTFFSVKIFLFLI